MRTTQFFFSTHKDLDHFISLLNEALTSLFTNHTSSQFITAPEMCQFIIFSHRKYTVASHVLLDSHSIQRFQSVRYLGHLLDPKPRWIPHFRHLFCHDSHWSNFLRSLVGTWQGCHPSALLIFHSAIKAKVDFSSFLIASVSLNHKKKIKSSSYVLPSPLRWNHLLSYCQFRGGMHLLFYRTSLQMTCW